MSMSSKTTPFILEVFFCQIQLAGPIEDHVKVVHTLIWSKVSVSLIKKPSVRIQKKNHTRAF